MTAVDLYVLCGGRGTRLKPFTNNTPKAMVPVAGRPFISHQLDLLRSQGFRKICLCIGIFGEKISNYVKCGAQFGLTVVYSHDGDEPIGTYSAISKAVKAHHTSASNSVPVIYGDSYLCADLQRVIKLHDMAKKTLTMTFCQSVYEEEKANVFIDGNRLFYDKTINKPDQTGFIDYGFSIFDRGVFDQRHKDLSECQMHLSTIGECNFVNIPHPYFEIGTKLGINRLETFFNNAREKK